MAYDLNLEKRIETHLPKFGLIVKKKMFGGIGYLINGNMCFGIHKDALVVRTTAEIAQDLLKQDHIRVFDITGRAMKGWIMVGPEFVNDDHSLLSMLETGIAFAIQLPKK